MSNTSQCCANLDLVSEKAVSSRLQDMVQTYGGALLLLPQLNTSVFFSLLKRMRGLKGKLLFSGVGKSGHIATKLASSFSSIGMPSVFLHPTDAAHGDLGLLHRDDILFVLSNSGQSDELTPVIQHALHLNLPLVAITSDTSSPLALKAAHVLCLPDAPEICPLGMAPTTSALLMLALGDMLLALLCEERGLTKHAYKALHPSGNLGFQLLTLCDVMHKGDELPLARVDTPLAEGVIEMTRKRLGALLVVDEEVHLLGILTDGDLRRAMRDDVRQKKVGDLMTQNP